MKDTVGQDLVFSFDDCIFGDVLTYEYLLHASICLRLHSFSSKKDCTSQIARSNNHANCLKGIQKFLLQDLGALPGDDVCKIRYRIFSVIDEMSFHQHHLCKINSNDTFTECCCEQHKFTIGYPKAYDHFIALLMLPEFEFENDFSVTQLLMDFKVQLVLQRCKTLDDLRILTQQVFGRHLIAEECERIPLLNKGHFGGEFMNHCQSFNEKFSLIDERSFERSIRELQRAHSFNSFEISFRNFLKNLYIRLPAPGIFANEVKEQEIESTNTSSCSEEQEMDSNSSCNEEQLSENTAVNANQYVNSTAQKRPIEPEQQKTSISQRCKQFVQEAEFIQPETLIQVFPGSKQDFSYVAAGSNPKVEEFLKEHTRSPSSVPSPKPQVRSPCASARNSEAPAKRNPFTEEETNWVKEGYGKFGKDWKRILTSYPFPSFRTSVDIKDKAKNLANKKEIDGYFNY